MADCKTAHVSRLPELYTPCSSLAPCPLKIVLTVFPLSLNVYSRSLCRFWCRRLAPSSLGPFEHGALLSVCSLLRTTASLPDQCSGYSVSQISNWQLMASPLVTKKAHKLWRHINMIVTVTAFWWIRCQFTVYLLQLLLQSASCRQLFSIAISKDA